MQRIGHSLVVKRPATGWRAALEAQRSDEPADALQTYLEQLIVRRELADNWCLYNPDYGNVAGYPAWARQTLARHAEDPRPHTYTLSQLDEGSIHDPLWNAAQGLLRDEGYLHSYLRMFWAKQLLLWTTSADEALADVLWLTDRYELDRRDLNGYVDSRCPRPSLAAAPSLREYPLHDAVRSPPQVGRGQVHLTHAQLSIRLGRTYTEAGPKGPASLMLLLGTTAQLPRSATVGHPRTTGTDRQYPWPVSRSPRRPG